MIFEIKIKEDENKKEKKEKKEKNKKSSRQLNFFLISICIK